MVTNLENTCNSLLQNIRTSGLNFNCQETPFSIYVTVRKSFVQPRTNTKSFPDFKPVVVQEHFTTDSKLSEVKVEHKNLKQAYDNVKNDLEDAIDELETKNKVIEDLEIVNANQSNMIEKLEAYIKNLRNDKKVNENENETYSIENKTIKKEISEMNDKTKATTKELKSLKKENKNITHDFEKVIGQLELKVKNLLDYKAAKIAEERKEKVEIKNKSKKLKAMEEKLAKVEMEKNDLERKAKLKIRKESKICQTDQTPDLPYEINSPLPPIFSSQLCHATPPIHFLSRSLPRLDKICWVQSEDNYLDEAEEFLNYQYDQQIKQFYLDAKEQAVAKKMADMKENKINIEQNMLEI